MNVLKAEPIDLLLTDLRMGGDSGMDLLDQAMSLPQPPLVGFRALTMKGCNMRRRRYGRRRYTARRVFSRRRRGPMRIGYRM